MMGKDRGSVTADRVLLRVTFWPFALVTVSLPAVSLAVCFITAFIFRFEDVNETMCEVSTVMTVMIMIILTVNVTITMIIVVVMMMVLLLLLLIDMIVVVVMMMMMVLLLLLLLIDTCSCCWCTK